jgi:hypothetical protein
MTCLLFRGAYAQWFHGTFQVSCAPAGWVAFRMLGASIFNDGKWIVPVVNPSLSKHTSPRIDSNNENRFVLRQLYRRSRASLVDKPILLDANMAC